MTKLISKALIILSLLIPTISNANEVAVRGGANHEGDYQIGVDLNYAQWGLGFINRLNFNDKRVDESLVVVKSIAGPLNLGIGSLVSFPIKGNIAVLPMGSIIFVHNNFVLAEQILPYDVLNGKPTDLLDTVFEYYILGGIKFRYEYVKSWSSGFDDHIFTLGIIARF